MVLFFFTSPLPTGKFKKNNKHPSPHDTIFSFEISWELSIIPTTTTTLITLQLETIFLCISLSFNITLFCLISFISIFLWLSYWVPYKTGRSIDYSKWEEQAPRTIQIATAFGVGAFIGSCTVLWSSYRYFSPFIVFFEMMGAVAMVSIW